MKNKPEKKKNGGKRPGSGRKKGSKANHTIQAEAMRKYVVERIAAEIGPIMDAQIALAKGALMSINGKNAFIEKPDVGAGKYLIDQGIGKAKEQVEVKHTGLTLRELHEQAKKLSDDDLEE